MNKEPDNSSIEISSEFIKILKIESTRARAICSSLNASNEFKHAVLPQGEGSNVRYNAEHLLLRDIIKVFNDLTVNYSNESAIPVKAKFILIFLYEQLRGTDLSETLDLQKINQLTLSSRFDKNVQLIREISFVNQGEEMQLEFIMPAILKRINSEHFSGIVALLTRTASLIVKADNKISKAEKELLQTITKKVNNPKIELDKAQYNEIPEDDSLEKVLGELHELIGMDEIKKSIEELTNFLKVQIMRKDKGLKTTTNSLHSVFMGPPGTGKTTVARLLGRIYKHLGYLERGHLIETDRAGMVAGYVGQTAIKAEEIIKSASGGVLFIDEAYSLSSGHQNDFGNEAIEILLKRMEDQRNKLVVVVAGYPDEMEDFILSNPGLQSRFNRYFKFDHFSVDALLKIFKLYAHKADFILSEDAEQKLLEILERVHEKRHKGFGNARTMRNLFERIIEIQANRVVSLTPITEDLLKILTEEDVPDILKTVKEITVFDEEGDG